MRKRRKKKAENLMDRQVLLRDMSAEIRQATCGTKDTFLVSKSVLHITLQF